MQGLPAPSLPLPVNLSAPLPAELAGRSHGWLSGYRRFAVFSPPWARGRVRVFGALAALALLIAVMPMVVQPPEVMPFGGVVQVLIQLFVPLMAGPWLGCWVRGRGWAPRREWAALVAVVAGLVLGMLAFHQWAAEPMKQWIAERAGLVDADGKRKRVVMAIGVMVSTPDTAASAAEMAQTEAHEPGSVSKAVNGVSSVLLSFWLAGGAALWGWRRERAGLQTLAREQELAHEQAQRREAELRLSVLAAQVEPHFLFNTLAGVRSAISTDPSRASEMIDKLVEYLRAAIPRLRSDGSAQATVGAQFDIVRAYLGLMSARMPRLQFDVDAPADLLTAHCPPLMLISLAENAVKHGVEPKIGPARVQVHAERTAEGQLALTVQDDGVGFALSPGMGATGSGLGLTNVRERLAQLYGTRAALTLKMRPQGGVAATLSLPLELAA